jgi:hypothetical protein
MCRLKGTVREHVHISHAVCPRTASDDLWRWALYSSSGVSFFLRGFRARGFPGVPALPSPLLDGKEGVDGSSPSEGFRSLTGKSRQAALRAALGLWQVNAKTRTLCLSASELRSS